METTAISREMNRENTERPMIRTEHKRTSSRRQTREQTSSISADQGVNFKAFYLNKVQPSDADIRRSRKNCHHSVLVTGSTGFVGSHLVAQLLKKGWSVIATSRRKEGVGAIERIKRLLRWHRMNDAGNLTVVDGDITAPRLGLHSDVYAKVCAMTGEIWHCAADTSFAKRRRQHVAKVNIEGTRNVLQLAMDSRCFFFHHVSTAYAVGKAKGTCKEEFTHHAAFHNAYEETKHEAEGQVLELCSKQGIRTHIYRPSIIIGDSKSGRSLLFENFYCFLRLFHHFKKLFEKDIEQKVGDKARKMGVQRTKDGYLQLPVRIGYQQNSTLNLVPIDFVIEACIEIMESCLDNGIYNIVNSHPSSLPDLVTFGSSLFGLQGVRAVPESEFSEWPRTHLERKLCSCLDAYMPYLCDQRLFASQNASSILDKQNIVCPRIEYDILNRCLQYALEVNWGIRLFEETRPPITVSGKPITIYC